MKHSLAIIPVALLTLFSCNKGNNLPDEDAVVSPEDWQAVSEAAGKIEKEDVVLEFPAGTFGSTDKVAITKMAAGAVGGNDEKSPFYQFSMPDGGSSHPVTVSFHYDGDPSEVRVAMKTEYYAMSLEECLKTVRILESTAENGLISVTIPETQSDEGDHPVFSLGLVLADEGPETTGTKADNPLSQWTFDWNMWSWEKAKYKSVIKQINDYLRTNIPYAQSLLSARGFQIPPIYYEIQDLGEAKKVNGKEPKFVWGYSVTPRFIKSRGYILLNVRGLEKVAGNPAGDSANELPKTLVHETLHALHTHCYDPRWALTEEISGNFGSQWTMLSEAIAVWSEQFADPAKCISGPAAEEDNYLRFVKSFFPPEWWVGSGNYASHGYGMAAFIQWLSKKTNPNSIVRLLQLQKEGYSDVRKVFDKFLEEKHLKFFDTEHYLEFAKSYCDGDLISGANYSMFEYAQIIKSSAPVSVSYAKSGGKVYSYGFAPAWFKFEKELMQAYADENLTFTQLTEGLESHVWYEGSSGSVYVGKTSDGAPLTLPIDQFIKNSSTLKILTITVKSQMTDDSSSLPSSLLISFDKPVGVPNIWDIGFSGDFVKNGTSYWMNEGWVSGSEFSTITVTPVSNGYEVYAASDWYELTFTITTKNGAFSDAVNIKNIRHIDSDSDAAYNFTIDRLPLKHFDSGEDASHGDASWYGSGSWYTGMEIEVYFDRLK